jgi:hypothetical protein
MRDLLHKAAIEAIANNDALTMTQKHVQAGKITREAAMGHKKDGKNNAEIAELLGIAESAVFSITRKTDIQNHETIWYPGIYGGRRTEPWTSSIEELEDDEIVDLVQQRASEDGEWAIENGFVGENNEHEPLMRKMMEWVSDEKNIRQCIEATRKEESRRMAQHKLQADPDDEDGDEFEPRTVDYICRDLANGSKWVGGSRG